MNTVLIIFSVVVFLISLGIFIRIDFHFDIFINLGHLKIYIFKIIPIINVDICLVGKNLIFTKKNTKVVVISIDLKEEDIAFVNDIQKNIVQRIYLNKFEVDAFVSLRKPNKSVLLSSAIKIFLSILVSKLSTKERDANPSSNVVTGFTENKIVLFLDSEIVISLFDILWSLIKAILNRRYLYGK